jgi:hypothetical protein
MKRIFIAFMVIVLGLCFTSSGIYADESSTKFHIPTLKKRTYDLGNKMPWEVMSAGLIEDIHNKGDVVFLYKDASLLEEKIAEAINYKQTSCSQYTKDENADNVAKYVIVFVETIMPFYLDKADYFTKLRGVATALEIHDYKLAKDRLNEAKQLRQ